MRDHLWLTIALAAAITYLTRIAGFALGARTIPPALQRFLRFVPIAAFASLTAPGLSAGGETLPRLLAAVAGAVAVLRFGRLWLCILVGMTVYWLARWVV